MTYFRALSIFLLLSLTSLAQQREYVIATYQYSTNDRLGSLQPLALYLQQRTGMKLRAASYPTVQLLIEATRERKVDLAMINTLGYLSLQKKFPGIVLPLVSLDPGGNGPTNYGGCIVAAKRSGWHTLDDLAKAGRISFAFVNNSSTSGNLVPRLLLNAKGITSADEKFASYYAGTHRKVVDDVLAGKAMAGGCGCTEYDNLQKSGTPSKDSVVLLASYNDIPLGPIVYQRTMPAAAARKFRQELLKVHSLEPAVFRQFCAGWTEFLHATKFRIAADEDYDRFRSMFGNNESLWMLLDN